jgi:hypothetical protein
MSSPSHDGDDAAESVLAIARQGAIADHQGAITGRQGASVNHQGTTQFFVIYKYFCAPPMGT